MSEKGLDKKLLERIKSLKMEKNGEIMLQDFAGTFGVKDTNSIRDLLLYVADNFGFKGAGPILSRAGYMFARELLNEFKEKGADLIRKFLEFLTLNGFGIFEENVDETGGEIVLKNSIFTENFQNIDECIDHFVVGMLTALLERAFNRRYIVLETECSAKGDPYCKFSVKLAQ